MTDNIKNIKNRRPTEHKLLLITTGGTIAGEVSSSQKNPDYEIKKAEYFPKQLIHLKDDLLKNKNIELDINSVEYLEIDSSDIMPEHWVGMANSISENYDGYDSFVITHGTNTLGYTCAALSFAFRNAGKPIIITGSQVPMDIPGTDATVNLENAIRIATWDDPRERISGVACVFGSYIISGTRVKKTTEFDYDAFRPYQRGLIGRIGRIVDIDGNNEERGGLFDHNKYYKPTEMPPYALSRKDLRVEAYFNSNILSITEYPGMDPSILQYLHIERKVEAFIIRAFGAGDLSTSFLNVLEFLQKKEVPVVITTQAPLGNANLRVNEPGQKIYDNKLGIPAHDMSIEAQTAKLCWLLAKKDKKQIDFKQLQEEMIKDYKGEIKINWEKDYSIS